jgi:hypothetical protein
MTDLERAIIDAAVRFITVVEGVEHLRQRADPLRGVPEYWNTLTALRHAVKAHGDRA